MLMAGICSNLMSSSRTAQMMSKEECFTVGGKRSRTPLTLIYTIHKYSLFWLPLSIHVWCQLKLYFLLRVARNVLSEGFSRLKANGKYDHRKYVFWRVEWHENLLLWLLSCKCSNDFVDKFFFFLPQMKMDLSRFVSRHLFFSETTVWREPHKFLSRVRKD